MSHTSDTTPSGSFFANGEAARRAIAMALPMIAPLMNDERIVGSGFVHIVLMDPALGPANGPACGLPRPAVHSKEPPCPIPSPRPIRLS